MDKIRRIDYRLATNAFIFTGLWFVIGAILLWSPAPGALGIGGELFAVWLVLFFVMLAASGSFLTAASLNAAFPTRPAPPTAGLAAAPRPASSAMWVRNAPGARSTPRNATRDG
jgi:hypothetical protein